MELLEHELFVNESQAKQAYDKLNRVIEQGTQHRDTVVQSVLSTTIVDKLIKPKHMHFQVGALGKNSSINFQFTERNGEERTRRIHPHAFGQICERVGLSGKFLRDAHISKDEWRCDAVSSLIQTYYHNTEFKSDTAFLHRFVGDELRGFLSRKFNRWLASKPLLDAFLQACDYTCALPVEAVISDVRVSLKCILPFIFQPVPGEYICLGVTWSNSDFGAGMLSVATSLWSARNYSHTVLDSALSRVHIGKLLQDSDLELSEDTAKKEVTAQCAAIGDVVMSQLNYENVDRVLRAIRAASEEKIAWVDIKPHLARLLAKADVQKLEEAFDHGVVDLPPAVLCDGEKVVSKWWAISAVGWLAENTSDPDRKTELQNMAGPLLEPFLKKVK